MIALPDLFWILQKVVCHPWWYLLLYQSSNCGIFLAHVACQVLLSQCYSILFLHWIGFCWQMLWVREVSCLMPSLRGQFIPCLISHSPAPNLLHLQRPQTSQRTRTTSCRKVELGCNEHMRESARTFGERHLEYFRAPSPIYDHGNTTGHLTRVENFYIVGKQSHKIMLNRNIGKYQFSHI